MRKLAALLLSSLTLSAYASDDKPVNAEAEVGALLTSGNTESTAFKGKLNIKHDMLRWRNSYLIEGLYKENEVEIIENNVSRTEDQVTAEKYFLSAQSDYKLNQEHRGLFVYGSYEEDTFSGYSYQGTIAAGYSDRLFKTENTYLNYSVGPGMAFYETEAATVNGVYIESETDSNIILRLAAEFVWQISETAKFTQLLSSDIATESDDNTKTKSETGITVAINSSFSMKAAYSIQNNSVVRDDVEETDTQTSLTLVYSY